MNARGGAHVIFDSDCESDWNGSNEEQDGWLKDDSL